MYLDTIYIVAEYRFDLTSNMVTRQPSWKTALPCLTIVTLPLGQGGHVLLLFELECSNLV
jgi:hypothetical protein